MRKLLVIALIWTLSLIACQKVEDSQNAPTPAPVVENTKTDCKTVIQSVSYFQRQGYDVVIVPDLSGYVFAKDTLDDAIYAVQTSQSNWCEDYVKVKIFK